jgi:hypothetical protein
MYTGHVGLLEQAPGPQNVVAPSSSRTTVHPANDHPGAGTARGAAVNGAGVGAAKTTTRQNGGQSTPGPPTACTVPSPAIVT